MKRFGLIGKTLKHSFSKDYFTRKFAALGIEGNRYDNFELPSIDDLSSVLEENPGLEGLNVTIPYKEAVIPFLQEADETVQAIGACNCIHIQKGRLIGFNTDAPAFLHTVLDLLKGNRPHALVLGSGGASKAVRYALSKAGISYELVSRQPGPGQLDYESLQLRGLSHFGLIVNTTPLGMYPNVDEAPPLPYSTLTPGHFLYDLTYNPPLTKFLKEGDARGAHVRNGYDMLVEQAEESWRIWNAHR